MFIYTEYFNLITEIYDVDNVTYHESLQREVQTNYSALLVNGLLFAKTLLIFPKIYNISSHKYEIKRYVLNIHRTYIRC